MNLKRYKNKMLYMMILLLFGILCGSMITYHFEFSLFDGVSFYEQLSQFHDRTYDYFTILFTNHMILLIIILLCSTSILGVLLIAVIIFMKGIQIGYSACLLIILYQLKGIVGIFIILIPSILLEVITIMIMSSCGLTLSMKLLNGMVNGKKVKLKKWFSQMLNELILSLLIQGIHCVIQVMFVLKISKWFHFW